MGEETAVETTMDKSERAKLHCFGFILFLLCFSSCRSVFPARETQIMSLRVSSIVLLDTLREAVQTFGTTQLHTAGL